VSIVLPRDLFLTLVEQRSTLGNGRFTGMRRLGKAQNGEFCVVCKALDTTTGRWVALKFFCPKSSRPDHAYRETAFEREAQVLELFVNQPNIVQRVAPLDTFEETASISGLSLLVSFPFYALELAQTVGQPNRSSSCSVKCASQFSASTRRT
jgi:serine/threonine protein kinase